jgi:hypothetical protein
VPVAVTLAVTIERLGRFSRLGAAAVILIIIAGFVQDSRQLARDASPLPPAILWAVGQVDASSQPASLVVSDSPIVPFLAHRQMPGSTIDTALLRFDTSYLTDAGVLRAIDQYNVQVVVAARSFLSRPSLLAALEKRFGPPRTRSGVEVFEDGRR